MLAPTGMPGRTLDLDDARDKILNRRQIAPHEPILGTPPQRSLVMSNTVASRGVDHLVPANVSNDVITVVGRVLIAAIFLLSGLSNRWLSHNNGKRARVFVSTRAAYRCEPLLERPLWCQPPSSESRTI
jgi:hypothetical protein